MAEGRKSGRRQKSSKITEVGEICKTIRECLS